MRKKVIGSLLILMLLVSSFAGCSEMVKSAEHLGDYVKLLDYHDDFTILQLTDIHWNNSTQIGDESYGSWRFLNDVIDEAVAHAGHIDLIEVTGDTFMLADKRAVEAFIEFMEGKDIPYAMVWGNHDREGKYNPNWISERFMEAKNCLYTEIDNDDVHERSNYVINLMGQDGQTAWQIFQLDSGASYREGAADLSLTYDYIRKNQLDWMSAEHRLVGEDVPCLAYYHIAQEDDSEYKPGTEGFKCKFFKTEDSGKSRYCSPTEQTFLDNNVKAAFIGHAHANDYTYTLPSGITYGYGVKSGTELYYAVITPETDGNGVTVPEQINLTGASLVTLKDTEGSFSLEHLYFNERDEGNFVMWVEY